MYIYSGIKPAWCLFNLFLIHNKDMHKVSLYSILTEFLWIYGLLFNYSISGCKGQLVNKIGNLIVWSLKDFVLHRHKNCYWCTSNDPYIRRNKHYLTLQEKQILAQFCVFLIQNYIHEQFLFADPFTVMLFNLFQ